VLLDPNRAVLLTVTYSSIPTSCATWGGARVWDPRFIYCHTKRIDATLKYQAMAYCCSNHYTYPCSSIMLPRTGLDPYSRSTHGTFTMYTSLPPDLEPLLGALNRKCCELCRHKADVQQRGGGIWQRGDTTSGVGSTANDAATGCLPAGVTLSLGSMRNHLHSDATSELKKDAGRVRTPRACGGFALISLVLRSPTVKAIWEGVLN
jgi:hypothetical protein